MWERIRAAACGLHDDEAGASMVEYAIVTAGIAVVAIVAVQSLGTAVVGVFNDIVSAIATV